MLDNDYFSHTNLSGQSPKNRIDAAGYPSSVAWGENIGWGGSTGQIDQEAHVYSRHQDLFLSPGHRQAMLSSGFREIGTGVRYGVFTVGGTGYNASMVTENFGNRSGDSFITGIVFADVIVADNFYTIGEGTTNILISAVSNGTGLSYSETTGPSGGYSLQVPDGTYTVTATGSSISPMVVSNVVVAQNVKVDFDTASIPVNVAPTITSAALTTATANVLYSYDVEASDPDVGDGLTFSLDSAPAGMTISSGTGLIQWTPTLSQTGANSVQVRVDDAGGLFDTQSFTVDVAAVSVSGDTATVRGTTGDDIFDVIAGQDYVTVNGVRYDFNASGVTRMLVEGDGGQDTITVTGDTGDDTATLSFGSVSLVSASYQIDASNVETVRMYGGGGNDTVTFYDSAGDDRYYARANTTESAMTGTGYCNYASGFGRTYAYSTFGGDDGAEFYDSTGDDQLVLRPSRTSFLTNNTKAYSQGFGTVLGYATEGGTDTIELYDSAGDESNDLGVLDYLFNQIGSWS
jgi:hypothetical protein